NVGREDARTDSLFREDHRCRAPVEGKRGRDLRTDEAAADHDELGAAVRERTQATIVIERSKVDHLFAAERKPPRPAAGREQQLLVRIAHSEVVARLTPLQIERDDPPAQTRLDTELVCSAPDRALLVTLPERLRERRSRVRRMQLLADQHDRTVGGEPEGPLTSGSGGQPASYEQITTGFHHSPPCLPLTSTDSGCWPRSGTLGAAPGSPSSHHATRSSPSANAPRARRASVCTDGRPRHGRPPHAAQSTLSASPRSALRVAP